MYEYGKPRKLRKQRPDVINEAEAFDREQEQDSDSDGRSIGTIETFVFYNILAPYELRNSDLSVVPYYIFKNGAFS